jgi:hypothetical protein
MRKFKFMKLRTFINPNSNAFNWPVDHVLFNPALAIVVYGHSIYGHYLWHMNIFGI